MSAQDDAGLDAEARLIATAKTAGVPVPAIRHVAAPAKTASAKAS